MLRETFFWDTLYNIYQVISQVHLRYILGISQVYHRIYWAYSAYFMYISGTSQLYLEVQFRYISDMFLMLI